MKCCYNYMVIQLYDFSSLVFLFHHLHCCIYLSSLCLYFWCKGLFLLITLVLLPCLSCFSDNVCLFVLLSSLPQVFAAFRKLPKVSEKLFEKNQIFVWLSAALHSQKIAFLVIYSRLTVPSNISSNPTMSYISVIPLIIYFYVQVDSVSVFT